MRLNPRLSALAAALLAVALAGCQTRHAPDRMASRAPPSVQDASGSREQLLTVAFAQNALQAMSLGSEVAALNNLDQAIGRSEPLQGSRWAASGRTGAGAPAPLDANAVNALLISAKAKLLMGDRVGVSEELKPIVEALPPGANPTELLLLRASGSLGLARDADEAGRLDEARIQLQAAVSDLQSVARSGAEESDEAASLARQIAGPLANPSSLAGLNSGQFAAWTGQVDRWLGGPSSGAGLVVAVQSSAQA